MAHAHPSSSVGATPAPACAAHMDGIDIDIDVSYTIATTIAQLSLVEKQVEEAATRHKHDDAKHKHIPHHEDPISATAATPVTAAVAAAAPSDPAHPPTRSAPRHCELCGFKYRVAVSSTAPSDFELPFRVESHTDAANSWGVFRCTRCGLVTTYNLTGGTDSEDELLVQPLEPSNLMEAVRAYKFILLSETSPLLKDLAQIVVDYLIWYRAPEDFCIGDLVDSKDLRGRWLLGRVDAIEHGKLLIHYIGYTSKWDSWVDAQSCTLAPCHTKSNGQQSKLAQRLRSDGALSWNAFNNARIRQRTTNDTETTSCPLLAARAIPTTAAAFVPRPHAMSQTSQCPFRNQNVNLSTSITPSPLLSTPSASFPPTVTPPIIRPFQVPAPAAPTPAASVSPPSHAQIAVNYAQLTRPAPSTSMQGELNTRTKPADEP